MQHWATKMNQAIPKWIQIFLAKVTMSSSNVSTATSRRIIEDLTAGWYNTTTALKSDITTPQFLKLYHQFLSYSYKVKPESQSSPRNYKCPSYLGFLSTMITESPRRNILLMNLSLFTGCAFFFPFPVFGTSVHISLTFSRTILQWRSKALTRPSSFLLFRQLIRTCVLFLTLIIRTERGPVLNSSSSFLLCWQLGQISVTKRLKLLFFFNLKT